METFPLETISPEKVSIYNSILGRRRVGRFPVGEHECTFRYVKEAKEYTASVFFRIKISDYYLWLVLEKLPPMSVFSKDLEGVDLGELPQEFQPIVLESFSGPILDYIEESLGCLLSIEQFVHEQPEGMDAEVLHFELEYGGEHINGRMHMDMACMEYMDVLFGRKMERVSDVFRDMEMDACVRVGEVELTLAEFKGLGIGDLMMFDGGHFVEAGACRVVIGNGLIYSGKVQGSHVTVNELIGMNEEESEAMDLGEGLGDSEPAMDGGDADISIDNPGADGSAGESGMPTGDLDVDHLPVNMVFEVGQKRISLADLESMQPGYTFELTNSAKSPVTIRANGRAIGEGELLKIGDRVGVRLSRFKDNGS